MKYDIDYIDFLELSDDILKTTNIKQFNQAVIDVKDKLGTICPVYPNFEKDMPNYKLAKLFNRESDFNKEDTFNIGE